MTHWVEKAINKLIKHCEENMFGFSSDAFEAKFMHLELLGIKRKIVGARNEQQYLNAIKEAERYILNVQEQLEYD